LLAEVTEAGFFVYGGIERHVDLPRKSGRVRDKDYAACWNCASYSAGLT
jgi:hypothetical protein